MAPNVESGLAANFFPALANGDTVVAGGIADQTFLANMRKLATVASQWWGWKERNPFSAESSRAPRPAAPGTALLFTGGVDSFCSLLRHPAEIQHFIHVHGFDIPLSDATRYHKARSWVDHVARACQIQPFYVTTNLRENAVFNSINWGITHMSALASVSHLLAEHVGRVLVAGSNIAPPWGSHERIDPLWSSDNLQFISDGCQLSRLEKVRFISGSELVHKYLKVCWENQSSDLNCGYCEKCVRTQAGFAVAGTFECLETFPKGHLREKIDGVPRAEKWIVNQWIDIRNGTSDPELRHAIERLLTRSRLPRDEREVASGGMKRFWKALAFRNA